MVLLFGLIASAPLLLNSGFLNTRGGGDSPFLLFRLHQMVRALSEGVFPVRWMPDAAFGLGYPFFNYYASLPFYFAALLKLLGLSYVLSLKLTQVGGFLLAGWGMYRWVARSTQSKSGALLASAAYTFAPYHMVNVYVRGDSLVEFWAMAWFPLILLAIREAALDPTRRKIALVALSYGALVMTHNVSALIFSPFVAGYTLVNWWQHTKPDERPRWRLLLMLASGGVLGLALAAWVWLPALGEQGYAQLGDQTTGFFFYGNHFRAGDLMQPTLAFNYDTGTANSSPFSMGLAQAVLIMIGGMALLALSARRSQLWYRGTILLGLGLATLMITPASAVLWENIPLLSFTQFPWRFLSIQALFGAAVIGMIAEMAERQSQRGGWLTVGIAGLVLGGGALIGLKPNFIPIRDADVMAERLQWYESFSGNIGTTIRYEYLPRWTQPRPYSSDVLLGQEPRAKFMSGAGEAERMSAGAASQVWEIVVENDSAEVALPILYWPGWQAKTLDGRESQLEVSPLEGLGYIKLQVPEGQHMIRLWLGRTPIRSGAEIASLVGLVVLAVLWQPRLPRMAYRRWAFVGGGVVAIAIMVIILHSLPERVSNRDTLSADFGQNAYLYSQDGGIPFSDGTVLEGIETVNGDGRISVDLRWSEEPDQGPSIWLAAPPQQSEQGAARYAVDTALDGVTPGLYFVQIERNGVFALTANGLQRGVLYGAPVLVAPGQTARPDASGEAIDFERAALLDVSTTASGEGLQVGLWWEALSEFNLDTSTALRLIDADGQEWAGLDTATGSAGLYPTGLWQPGEIVADNYLLDLPPGTPPGTYTLRVTLYDGPSTDVFGMDEIPVSQSWTTPTSCDDFIPLNDEAFGLRDVQIPEQGVAWHAIEVRIDWVSCQPLDEVYRVRWLFDGEAESFSIETDLVPGSNPADWTIEAGRAALVTGRHRLEMPAEFSAGNYALRMQMVGEDGDPVGSFEFLGEIDIVGEGRVFALPELEHMVQVDFGDQIGLRGYEITGDDTQIRLDVAWEALDDLGVDYKFFVHVLEADGEAILAQIDSMPRDYGYPTSLWVAGEIVEDQLVLDVSEIPSGEYRIAIGWYVEGGDRLSITDGGDDRYFLEELIPVR